MHSASKDGLIPEHPASNLELLRTATTPKLRDLLLKFFDESTIILSCVNERSDTVVCLVPMELDFTALALDFHPWALLSPVPNDLVGVREFVTAAKLAVRLELRQLAFLSHVCLKSVIRELASAQGAFKELRVEPSHHYAVHFIVEADTFGAKWALFLAYNLGTIPPFGQAGITLQPVALFALPRPLDNIVADAADKFSFKRLLDRHVRG